MATSHYFQSGVPGGRSSEQLLIEDLIIECMKIYGFDTYYLPRKTVYEDGILNEDALNSYDDAYALEMYMQNVTGFEGDGDLLTKFGVEIRDTATFLVARRRWESKLNEAREQVRAELREEFAQRYEHDRYVMVEALDKMVSEGLQHEIEEFQTERQAMNEDRVIAQQKLRESATKFNDFMVTKLAEEIKELRSERKLQMESQEKLEQFIVHALAREIKEFTQDKQAVVEAKVKLVAEGRIQLEALKARFVAESAKRLTTVVANQLKGELGQLKEDIKIARENNFGRRIFESFASEFSVTHLSEKAETRKLMTQLEEKDKKLAESINTIGNAKKLIESKEREVRIIKESNLREKTMGELLATLNEEKASVMQNLLESVQTPRLQAAFDKYLPAVLNNGNVKPAQKAKLTESVIVEATGDKAAKQEVDMEQRDNVIDIKRLAGL